MQLDALTTTHGSVAVSVGTLGIMTVIQGVLEVFLLLPFTLLLTILPRLLPFCAPA